MGALKFRCPVTGQEFRSGFHATAEEIRKIPADATIELRCEICKECHCFLMARCSIDED